MSKKSKMVDRVKSSVEKQWQLQRRIDVFFRNNGSKYPPFSIEHMPFERQRLSGTGMTAEDRRLRKQFLTDQHLHETPKHIPELEPKNWFRRMYGKPWDFVFRAATPLLGNKLAGEMRWFVPKVVLSLVIGQAVLYQLTYNRRTWETISGWEIIQTKPLNYSGVLAPQWDRTDYYDQGFKSRTIMVDEIKTSRNPDD